jgi:uncharacterized protein DUF4491
MNLFGLIIGLVTLLIIGLGFPLVIQTERRLGYLWWPYMLGVGILLVALSLIIRTDWVSVLTAVLGATFIWGCTELKAQAVRVELGWFSANEHKVAPPFVETIMHWKVPHL